ncbi:hypothetical protein Droror1_Dr00011180 [Drosera rotundifolia]
MTPAFCVMETKGWVMVRRSKLLDSPLCQRFWKTLSIRCDRSRERKEWTMGHRESMGRMTQGYWVNGASGSASLNSLDDATRIFEPIEEKLDALLSYYAQRVCSDGEIG